ncbi:hypothetical protein FEV09_01210 [Pseudanabaena catenata USMAC16]|uniref:Uncharacterized protein n=1 Tax=Pseudanabaena catenata USMAC16 TaxID=1855837 RepID=A0A9X4RFW3_9CYAN|nr:hypothetical protein [Pseudanabaena catenata]MDG3493168.1 hypothetical protein [Pseudanabaena catenata USMAC16]
MPSHLIPKIKTGIAIVSNVRTKIKPNRELRREAPQLSMGFDVLT